MINPETIGQIKQTVEEFLTTMTVDGFSVAVAESVLEDDKRSTETQPLDGVQIDITLEEPQFLIGQGGQTLVDVQRLVKMILNKKLGRPMHVKLDINNYRAQKIDYVKKMATEAADEVASTKVAKTLAPMSSYERRIIHAELASRTDVKTESQGEGFGRCVVILPK